MKRIQILGAGCPKCRKLADNAEAAARAAGVACAVERITDLVEILKFDISGTPALVIDGQIKSVGQVLSIEELEELLKI